MRDGGGEAPDRRELFGLEELLLDAMYTLPSQKRIKEFVITSEMVERRRAVPGEGLTGVDGAAA